MNAPETSNANAKSPSSNKSLDQQQLEADITSVLSHYPVVQPHGYGVAPIDEGLINRTFRVTTREPGGAEARFILQRVNAIFPPEIHEDIESVTRELERRGLMTPHLLRTNAGQLYTTVDQQVWRLMTHIDGETFSKLPSVALAKNAGALLGSFHGALARFDHSFKNARLGVHDTPRHLRVLREALEGHRAHTRYDVIAPLGEAILEAASRLQPLPRTADRIVHGDPKISNILFERGTGRALCMVDLDTLAHMPLPLELGDALRSWCNPSGEDTVTPSFSLDLFAAAVQGYASTGKVADEEWRSIVLATQTITLELSARFCADALNDRYFGWDPKRFPSRSEHNRVRAAGQLALAASLDESAEKAEAIVEKAFGA